MRIDELVRKLKSDAEEITVSCAAMGISAKYRVVEGDHGLREEDVLTYASERIAIADAVNAGKPARRGLVAIEVSNKILRWDRGKVLDYCVWRPSFATDAEYESVVQSTKRASDDWAGICGVRFHHRHELDTDDAFKAGGDVFPVMRSPGGGSIVALAFFPNWNAHERIVWIRDGYFDKAPVFDPVGVLRHELGHVLGFRHEHIRPEVAHLFRPEDVTHINPLTKYDRRSVMHYLGEGMGDPNLQFTEDDRTGAVMVYGEPDSKFEFAT